VYEIIWPVVFAVGRFLFGFVYGRRARSGPVVATLNDKDYELSGPTAYSLRRALIAPLASHVCINLVRDALSLHYVIHDPGKQKCA
jgi:hypothetical protein